MIISLVRLSSPPAPQMWLSASHDVDTHMYGRCKWTTTQAYMARRVARPDRKIFRIDVQGKWSDINMISPLRH